MSSANDAPKMELISLLASRNEFIPACPARTCTLSQHGFGGGVCAHTGGHTCCTGSVTWRAGGRRRDANCVLDDAVRLRRRIHLLALFDPAFENRSHVKGLERGRKLVLILHTVTSHPESWHCRVTCSSRTRRKSHTARPRPRYGEYWALARHESRVPAREQRAPLQGPTAGAGEHVHDECSNRCSRSAAPACWLAAECHLGVLVKLFVHFITADVLERRPEREQRLRGCHSEANQG